MVATRCQNVLEELKRVPTPARETLAKRGLFADFHSTLVSALDFCKRFKERGFLVRVLNHR
jgi:hypothetical protein